MSHPEVAVAADDLDSQRDPVRQQVFYKRALNTDMSMQKALSGRCGKFCFSYVLIEYKVKIRKGRVNSNSPGTGKKIYRLAGRGITTKNNLDIDLNNQDFSSHNNLLYDVRHSTQLVNESTKNFV